MPAPWETQGGSCLRCETDFNWWESDGNNWKKNICPNCGWDPENWRDPYAEAFGQE